MPVLTKINTNSIAEDAITGDKFAGDTYLANTANQNISGTYSENRLYTSDAYTLSGNATVNSHLTLSSVKSTGDVVLTAGGAYTITGTGVLSGGSLLAKERSDLTGMTGELGSVVIGAPALTGLGTVTSGTYNATIGSSATFPTNHIVQVKTSSRSDRVTVNATGTHATVGIPLSITPKYDDSILVVKLWCKTDMSNASFLVAQQHKITRNVGSTESESATAIGGAMWMNYLNRNSYTSDFYPPLDCMYFDTSYGTTNQLTYGLFAGRYQLSSNNASWYIGDANDNTNSGFDGIQMMVMEIKQ